jgi:hypothetical protein
LVTWHACRVMQVLETIRMGSIHGLATV